MPVKLLPLVKEDVDEAVGLIVASYANNPFRKLLFPTGMTPSRLEELRGGLVSGLDNSDKQSLKVVDEDTGEMAACAIWAYTKPMTTEDWDRENEKALRPYPEARQEILLEFFDKEQESRRRIMGHTRWWELESLNTLPKFQRRGIGSLLMDWGIQKLEETQVPSFILSTDQGYGLYIKHGYKEVERWEIDMGRWPQWGGIGMYRNVFLTRYPITPAPFDAQTT